MVLEMKVPVYVAGIGDPGYLIKRAKELFGAEHVNVQPYSGSPANVAVYLAFLKPGDTILGMALGGWMAGWIYDTSGSYRLAVWNGIAWNVLNISIALILLTRIGPRRAPA